MVGLLITDAIMSVLLYVLNFLSGTKGVAKAMKEISCDAQKWEIDKWFAELSDKLRYLPVIVFLIEKF